MITGLDRSNETIAKHLEEYDQAAAELTIRERIELISELVKYQDHHSKILKYQAQQIKSRTKKKKRDFYMAVIRNNLGWKVKDFKGMSFEEVEAKFKTVWEQIEGGVSKISEGEATWLKKKGIRSEQESAKKQKTTEEVPEEVKSCDEIPEEKIKELIRLIPIEEVYIEALQVKHPIIDWKGELSAEQAFWSRYSVQPEEPPNLSSSTTIVEVPKELPKVSMVNSSLKKHKFHLASFDMVVKERTTTTAISEGTWRFEHTKACFRDENIPFVKALKELFNSFDQFLIDELTEVQNVFNQIEQAVEQQCVENNKFKDKMKNVLNDN
nr:hypothetical protein [Tanacetum cinerariifolium]